MSELVLKLKHVEVRLPIGKPRVAAVVAVGLTFAVMLDAVTRFWIAAIGTP